MIRDKTEHLGLIVAAVKPASPCPKARTLPLLWAAKYRVKIYGLCVRVRNTGQLTRFGSEALLKRACDARKGSVGVRPDEPQCSDYDHQNDSQHHRVLGNVLASILGPSSVQMLPEKLRYRMGRAAGK